MRPRISLVSLLIPLSLAPAAELREQAEAALRRGAEHFAALNVQGGYGYFATPDLSQRWGESPLGADEVEVQPPGTPAVGQSFLRIYLATGDEAALANAQAAAEALIRGQNRHGGWGHTIDFADLEDENVSFDDNQSQAAISFLMALDRAIDEPRLTAAVMRALDMMIATQLPNGGWPHMYPERGNYHDYATFNDGGINDCIRVMLEAHAQYEERRSEVRQSLRRAARFILIAQLPPPQPGWAQQYNEYLQPAWARAFEPPSVSPAVTVRNIQTLIDLHLALGDGTLLEAIPDALRWLNAVRLENGKWARFVEIGTNEALYYDRGRIRVESVADLHPERRLGYGYETDLEPQLKAATRRYEKALRLGAKALRSQEEAAPSQAEASKRVEALSKAVRRILAEQEPSGAWITRDDRFRRTMPRGERWNGEYETMDRISSSVFNRNVSILCEYLELSALLASPDL